MSRGISCPFARLGVIELFHEVHLKDRDHATLEDLISICELVARHY